MNELVVHNAEDTDIQRAVGTALRDMIEVVYVHHVRLYVCRNGREVSAAHDLTCRTPGRKHDTTKVGITFPCGIHPSAPFCLPDFPKRSGPSEHSASLSWLRSG